MREQPVLTDEQYKLMKIILERSEVPADALTALTSWIEKERLLVDEREDVGGMAFLRMDAKFVAPLPHVMVSFFARRPYKRKEGHYPRRNTFSLLVYRDGEEGWKLIQVRKDSTYVEFAPVIAARSKAIREIKRRFGNDLEDHEE
jgi:hypothetical protein